MRIHVDSEMLRRRYLFTPPPPEGIDGPAEAAGAEAPDDLPPPIPPPLPDPE